MGLAFSDQLISPHSRIVNPTYGVYFEIEPMTGMSLRRTKGRLYYETCENIISLSDISVSSKTVVQVLFRLKRYFTSGPDGIPASVLVNCKDVLVPHLF